MQTAETLDITDTVNAWRVAARAADAFGVPIELGYLGGPNADVALTASGRVQRVSRYRIHVHVRRDPRFPEVTEIRSIPWTVVTSLTIRT